MTRSSDGDDDPADRTTGPASEAAEGSPRDGGPDHEGLHPWMSGPEPETGADEEDEPPWIVAALGQLGLYLALASLAGAVLGIAGMYVGFQPWGNIATTVAIVGVSIAMVFAMAFQAYVGDHAPGR